MAITKKMQKITSVVVFWDSDDEVVGVLLDRPKIFCRLLVIKSAVLVLCGSCNKSDCARFVSIDGGASFVEVLGVDTWCCCKLV